MKRLDDCVALADIYRAKVPVVENVVRVEVVRGGRCASACKKTRVFGQIVRRIGQRRFEIRNHYTRLAGSSVLPLKSIYND